MNLPPLLTHLPPIGPDEDLIAVIETPKGSPNKYKYEETYEAFRLNTVMPKGSFGLTISASSRPQLVRMAIHWTF